MNAALVFLALITAPQLTSEDRQALRKYRYGLSAEQVAAMSYGRYHRFFVQHTIDADTGPMRGVPYAAYVFAKREVNDRARAKLPRAEQTRLLALDKQMRFLGVLAARNEWLFLGGNGFSSESDTEAMADAERELLTGRTTKAGRDPSATIVRYERWVLRRARTETMFGAGEGPRGPAEIRSNIAKMRSATARAQALTRNARERGVLARFLARELGTTQAQRLGQK